MMRIRRKFAFILCGACLSAFLFVYFLINHSLSTDKSVRRENRAMGNTHPSDPRQRFSNRKFIFFLFYFFQKNLESIETKIQQLEHGLDVHRLEVGEIRKQINSIQEKSNSKQSNEDQPENLMLVAGAGELNDDVVQSKCDFRTDVDPRTDIQVRFEN